MSNTLVYTLTLLGVCSSKFIRLPSITSSNENCFTETFVDEGKFLIKCVLGDFSEFNSSGTRPILLTETYGEYSQGKVWDDLCQQHNIVGIRQLQIFYSVQINSIQVTYILANGSLYTSPTHGSKTGNNVSIMLNEDERFTLIEGRVSSSGITQLVLVSKNSSGFEKSHGPFGEATGLSFTVEGYILGFRGYASDEVHGLNVYYLPPINKSRELLGGTGRDNLFDDNVNSIIPPVIGINSITLRHGLSLDSIQTNYSLLGGSIHIGDHYGGYGGNPTTVTLQKNEALNRLVIRPYFHEVIEITLYTTQSMLYGPYGSTSSEAAREISGNIIGFHGFYSSRRVLQIGIYTI